MIDARRRVSALTFLPLDNPDWDHARTRRLALRTPRAEWCQSVVSALEPDGFWYHRVDYAHEGLLALIQEESWKVLDRLGFRLLVGGQAVALRPGPLTVTPDWAVYRFEAAEGRLSVRYQLLEAPGAGGAVLVATYAWEGEPGATILLKPVLDVRHTRYFSDPEGHQVERLDDRLLVAHHHRHLAIASDAPFAVFPDRQVRPLCYRLGSGEREAVRGQVHFKREFFRGLSFGGMAFDLAAPFTLAFAASASEAVAIAAVHEGLSRREELVACREAVASAYHERLAVLPIEVASRVYVMAEKFAQPHEGRTLPSAGAWWARAPWLPSVLEGLLHNRQTLQLVGRGGLIDEAIRQALPHRDPLTILLLFDFLAEHLSAVRDASLLFALYEAYRRAFSAFEGAERDERGGGPVLEAGGLLVSLPTTSWMDGVRALEADGIRIGGLPTRMDPDWQREAIAWLRDARHVQALFQTPAFYLPELNARWIRMLEVGMALADRHGDEVLLAGSRAAYRGAIASYKRVFWNPRTGFLHNLVTREGRADPTRSVTAIEAAARLGERVFTRAELASIWVNARDHLLVRRSIEGRPVAFGLIAKESAERIYLGPPQAHEAVCWPSKTPYLLRLLAQLGEFQVIREILATNLAHQLDEGAVFYASEMMSLPEGDNPSTHLATGRDPVPVGNPMHWASLWCDPYLAAMAE